MKSKKFSREHIVLFMFALLILGSFLILSLLFYYYTPKIEIQLSLEKKSPVAASVDEDYERQIKTIFRRYLNKRTRLVDVEGDGARQEWSAAVREAKQELLQLRVSGDRLAGHLRLVLSLDKISDYLAGKSLLDAVSFEEQLIKMFNL